MTTKKLTKCEDCKKPLPVHLLGLGLKGDFQHICSCTAAYVEQDGKFVRAGNQRNPVAEYDTEQMEKKKAKKAAPSEGPIFLTLSHKGEVTQYGLDVPTAESVVAGLTKQIARAKRIMGRRAYAVT